MLKYLFSLIVLFAVPTLAQELTVLEKPRPQMLRDALRVQVHAALDKRLQAYEARTDPAEITAWQQDLRSKFVESLGGYPKRTPLNPQIVGKFEADGYRVENLIYESRPQFFVTANLYLPKTKPPYPAVLVPCGHSPNGKAAGAYQRISILLAKHGIAALCYDPVGQGERKQILKTNTKGDPLPIGEFTATGEHTITGVAPILLGENLASYRIWDGIRSIDYLTSRPDIDPKRIGCTGNSGGGMMTSYLVALDDRIQAAAPGCFITTTRIKNERPGPGDAEQNIFSQTA
ncbi:MAG: acetylxylan esterase, partial [Planctomycetaceae bacterium]|nr:acetylxylan esterase [Planctomycetaceae bacterium]